MIKKFLSVILISVILCLAIPAIAGASMGESLNKTAEQAEINQDQDLVTLSITIIRALLSVLGLIFVILIIYGGVTWMTAMGQEDKIKKAKNTLKNSVIGLLIIMISYAIVFYIIFLLDQADVMYFY